MADYTTTAEVKTYLHISGTGDDSLIGDLVTRASRMIDAYCGRWFYARTETRKYDAVGHHITGRLLLLDADLLTITTLKNGDGSTINAADIILRPVNMEPYFGISLRQSSGLSWTYDDDSQACIEVAGTWGYSATTPQVIAHAVVRLAAWLYRQRDSGMDSGQVEVTERGVSVAPARLPRDVAELLAPYVRVRIVAEG